MDFVNIYSFSLSDPIKKIPKDGLNFILNGGKKSFTINSKDLGVKRQYEILNSNGIVCHSFWKGEGSEIFKGLFVNYHNEAGLREVFKNYFKILSIENYKEFTYNIVHFIENI